jgi:hypothetical protein
MNRRDFSVLAEWAAEQNDDQVIESLGEMLDHTFPNFNVNRWDELVDKFRRRLSR